MNYWIKKYGWKDQGDLIYIASQDANIKTKNISEKIEFENLSTIMSKCLWIVHIHLHLHFFKKKKQQQINKLMKIVLLI